MARTSGDIGIVLASLDMAEDEIMKAVGAGIIEGIDGMEAEVKATAPRAGDVTPKINGGGKQVDYNIGSYTFKNIQNDGRQAEFGITGAASDLAAFIEFGTGQDAKSYVPTLEDDFQRQAMQFYKNGKGTLAHVPFFIPAWIKAKDKILTLAQENINKLDIR